MLRELGSPEKVAAIIKADLKGSAGGYEYGEYTEHGYEDARTKREDRCLRNMEKSREQGSVFQKGESGGADPCGDPAGFYFSFC